MIVLEPFSFAQKRHLAEVLETWRLYEPVLQKKRDLVGGMQWKTIGGHRYLYRYGPDPVTKRKKSTSLGRQSPETEAIYNHFMTEREWVRDEFARLTATLETQVRVSKALRIGRVTRPIIDVLDTVREAGLAPQLLLMGDVAICALETHTFNHADFDVDDRPIEFFVTTDDIDDIVDAALESLRTVDPGYRFDQHALAFEGKLGPKISLITPQMLAAYARHHELSEADTDTLIASFEAPPIETVVIGRAGHLTSAFVVDPRALAMTHGLESIDPHNEHEDRGQQRMRAMAFAGFAGAMDLEFEPAHLDIVPALQDYLDEEAQSDGRSYL
ncbi:hypothetical protein NO932_02475 [Pelagibacterium sp. 26DY04]|uniref:hypothetical protein n=1 Tax=Pelagibacterium sp. 26DY04 TaxID=2967130 RepID=UPI0028169C31|nr:hypothetical protein [Pelagibacterium sp. 26DY04]WMT87486.1 hypothetical protein NO932_02475 [Pelagibacterium sp. 26DY04]